VLGQQEVTTKLISRTGDRDRRANGRGNPPPPPLRSHAHFRQHSVGVGRRSTAAREIGGKLQSPNAESHTEKRSMHFRFEAKSSHSHFSSCYFIHIFTGCTLS